MTIPVLICLCILGLGIFWNLTIQFLIFNLFFIFFIIVLEASLQENLPQLIGIEYNS